MHFSATLLLITVVLSPIRNSGVLINPTNECSSVPTTQTDNWEKPEFIEFGSSLEEIKEYLGKKGYDYEERNITPIELPTATESQIQLDVQGVKFGGKERFAELIFADGVFDMVWILTEAEEEEIIKKHFAEEYGNPTHVMPGAWFHLNDGVGLRNEPNEVLFISERLKQPYRMWFKSMGVEEQK